MECSYKIAGLTVNMDTFGFAYNRASPYRIEYTDQPDVTIPSDYSMLKNRFPTAQEAMCAYTASASYFYRQLPLYDGILIHSSTVVMDGKAYMFSADSGTGKSTHTALYRRVYGDDRVRILNDDKPAVRLENGQFFAYGTPWSGKSDLNLNLRVPLGGICILQRGEKNEIEPMPARKALFVLLQQTVHPEDEYKMGKVLEILKKLLETVPIWSLRCNMDPEAVKVSYEAMSGMRKDERK